MEELTKFALEKALSEGASYADIRIIRRERESIMVKNGKVEVLTSEEDEGFGVRVIAEGAWGFASSSKLEKDEIKKTAELAVRIAKASAKLKKEDVSLAPLEPVVETYETKIEKDPFSVPFEEKIELLLDCDKIIRQEPKVQISEASLDFFKENKVFASSEGSYIDQKIVYSGGNIAATAVEGQELQHRSYPGDYAAKGYEFIESLHLPDFAEKVAREAAALLKAKQCPEKVTTLILDGGQLALQVHESCGHPIELDRVLGTEASFAGTSFLTPDKLNKFKYGSDIVNIVADATLEGGLGTFGFDDEGVPAQRTEIIKEGIFSGYLTSRETASQLNQLLKGSRKVEELFGTGSNGAMRADGWNRIPLIRMTNINLEPGDWTLDEMIKDTKEGIYMERNRSWSIDDKRLNFQFGTEIAYEIKEGSLGDLIKNPTYTGITYQFWNSCDAIANKKFWRLWGVPGCGKGEPMQSMQVGHGTSPARFRNIRIGVMR